MGWCALLARKYRTVKQLSAGDRGWLVITLLGLPAIALLLQGFGLKRTQSLLARCSPSPSPLPPTAKQQQQAQRLAHLVRRAARYYHCTCLRQALLVWWLLRWRGLASELRLGVRHRAKPGLDAHAWVECGAIALGEPQSPQPPYTAFTPFN